MINELPRILLVEEDPTLAEVTLFRLELMGYVVEHVATGTDAMLSVQNKLPDAILLDLALPDIDGLEIANRLSNDSDLSVVPILAFSSDSNLDNVQRAYSAGIKDYLVTPYDPAVLESKLENLINQTDAVFAETVEK